MRHREYENVDISPAERIELSLLLYQAKLSPRLDEEAVASVLGVQAHCIKVLRDAGLSAPLGKPSQQTPKSYAAVDV